MAQTLVCSRELGEPGSRSLGLCLESLLWLCRVEPSKGCRGFFVRQQLSNLHCIYYYCQFTIKLHKKWIKGHGRTNLALCA